ncbi:MAG: hypothetical protein QM809_12475 [Gordonia sp. (in: high G+C Gram-positive bacteria)]|uniref:hypothetical protein n=1 Tax=Gordonia sp. (in: high G+C Gram-positive bacteria) TaxID=84139 RepID=UPI0039E5EDBE
MACAKYRDYDGRTRVVERFAKTGAAVERALVNALTDRSTLVAAAADINGTTPATLILAQRQDEGRLAPQTLAKYRKSIDYRIVPALGGVHVCEATVGSLDAFLRALESSHVRAQCQTRARRDDETRLATPAGRKALRISRTCST